MDLSSGDMKGQKLEKLSSGTTPGADPNPGGRGGGSEEDLLFSCLGLKGNSEQRRDSLGV